MPSTIESPHVPETALRVLFAPILIAYVIGSLPILVPVVAVRWLARRMGAGVLPAAGTAT